MLAFEHKDLISSWKVRLISTFIPISSSDEVVFMHEFCICIDFVSYGLAYSGVVFSGISSKIVLGKPFEYINDIRF